MSAPMDGPEDPVSDALLLVSDAPESAQASAGDEIPQAAPGLVSQARTDAQLLELWLFGRSPHTQRAYRREAARFLAHAGKPLRAVTLGDVQAFATALATEPAAITPASRARALAAVKSLLAFGHRLGYLPFDVVVAARLPRLRGALAERTLSEADMHRLLALEPNTRDRALLRLAYAGALRCPSWSPCAGATCRRCGRRQRAASAADDGPVFGSRKGGHLTARQARRLLDAAAKRAGLRARVSPHWLRHAHATHALEREAPIHIVQVTLGHARVATTGRYLQLPARPADRRLRPLPGGVVTEPPAREVPRPGLSD